jgi:hypothetical protein
MLFLSTEVPAGAGKKIRRSYLLSWNRVEYNGDKEDLKREKE